MPRAIISLKCIKIKQKAFNNRSGFISDWKYNERGLNFKYPVNKNYAYLMAY